VRSILYSELQIVKMLWWVVYNQRVIERENRLLLNNKLQLPIMPELNSNPGETERKCVTCPVMVVLETGSEWKTQCVDCFKDERTKRECKLCKKKKICVMEPSYKDVCSLCYKEAPMKPCSKCKEYVIKAFEWRSMCSPCFKLADFERPCQSCKIRPIGTHLPSYVISCTKCYLEKKKLTHDACPWCPKDPTRKLTLNKRKEAPGCRDCMTSKGMITLADFVNEPQMVLG
jgi:hypothetical protein